MVEDKVVKILGAVWNCVDVGFGHNKPVDAVSDLRTLILLLLEKELSTELSQI